jgi:hypothetical protein
MDEVTAKAINQICDTIENCVDYSKTTKIRVTFFIAIFSTLSFLMFCGMLVEVFSKEEICKLCKKDICVYEVDLE